MIPNLKKIFISSVVDPVPHGSGTFAWIRIRNSENSELDPNSDPEYIISDPQHWFNEHRFGEDKNRFFYFYWDVTGCHEWNPLGPEWGTDTSPGTGPHWTAVAQWAWGAAGCSAPGCTPWNRSSSPPDRRWWQTGSQTGWPTPGEIGTLSRYVSLKKFANQQFTSNNNNNNVKIKLPYSHVTEIFIYTVLRESWT